MLPLSHKARLRLAMSVIPLLAVSVAVRQAYLSSYYGLSTWKGGGMGMFAAADTGQTRFTKIYLELPDGTRQPIINPNTHQRRLMDRAMLYPTRENFEKIASSMRKTNWQGSNNKVFAIRVDRKGERLGFADGKPFYMLSAFGTRDDPPDWTLAIEYWNTDYDPLKRTVQARLIDTMRF